MFKRLIATGLSLCLFTPSPTGVTFNKYTKDGHTRYERYGAQAVVGALVAGFTEQRSTAARLRSHETLQMLEAFDRAALENERPFRETHRFFTRPFAVVQIAVTIGAVLSQTGNHSTGSVVILALASAAGIVLPLVVATHFVQNHPTVIQAISGTESVRSAPTQQQKQELTNLALIYSLPFTGVAFGSGIAILIAPSIALPLALLSWAGFGVVAGLVFRHHQNQNRRGIEALLIGQPHAPVIAAIPDPESETLRQELLRFLQRERGIAISRSQLNQILEAAPVSDRFIQDLVPMTTPSILRGALSSFFNTRENDVQDRLAIFHEVSFESIGGRPRVVFFAEDSARRRVLSENESIEVWEALAHERLRRTQFTVTNSAEFPLMTARGSVYVALRWDGTLARLNQRLRVAETDLHEEAGSLFLHNNVYVPVLLALDGLLLSGERPTYWQAPRQALQLFIQHYISIYSSTSGRPTVLMSLLALLKQLRSLLPLYPLPTSPQVIDRPVAEHASILRELQQAVEETIHQMEPTVTAFVDHQLESGVVAPEPVPNLDRRPPLIWNDLTSKKRAKELEAHFNQKGMATMHSESFPAHQQDNSPLSIDECLAVKGDAREALFVRMGHLFYLDKRLWMTLTEELRQTFSRNIILVDRLHTTSLVQPFLKLPSIATHVAASSVRLDGHRSIHVGAREGLEALTAWRNGASSLWIVDYDIQALQRARQHLAANGLREGTDYFLVYADLTDEKQLRHGFERAWAQAERSGRTETRSVVFADIGPWMINLDNNDRYTASNETIMDRLDLMEALTHSTVDQFVSSGYITNIHLPDKDFEKRYRAAMRGEREKIQKRGFTILPGWVRIGHSDFHAEAWTATRAERLFPDYVDIHTGDPRSVAECLAKLPELKGQSPDELESMVSIIQQRVIPFEQLGRLKPLAFLKGKDRLEILRVLAPVGLSEENCYTPTRRLFHVCEQLIRNRSTQAADELAAIICQTPLLLETMASATQKSQATIHDYFSSGFLERLTDNAAMMEWMINLAHLVQDNYLVRSVCLRGGGGKTWHDVVARTNDRTTITDDHFQVSELTDTLRQHLYADDDKALRHYLRSASGRDIDPKDIFEIEMCAIKAGLNNYIVRVQAWSRRDFSNPVLFGFVTATHEKGNERTRIDGRQLLRLGKKLGFRRHPQPFSILKLMIDHKGTQKEVHLFSVEWLKRHREMAMDDKTFGFIAVGDSMHAEKNRSFTPAQSADFWKEIGWLYGFYAFADKTAALSPFLIANGDLVMAQETDGTLNGRMITSNSLLEIDASLFSALYLHTLYAFLQPFFQVGKIWKEEGPPNFPAAFTQAIIQGLYDGILAAQRTEADDVDTNHVWKTLLMETLPVLMARTMEDFLSPQILTKFTGATYRGMGLSERAIQQLDASMKSVGTVLSYYADPAHWTLNGPTDYRPTESAA